MLINDFLVFLEVEKGYSEKTIREYSYDLQMFNNFSKKKSLESCSTTDLRRFFLHLKRDKSSYFQAILSGDRPALLTDRLPFLIIGLR